MAIQFFRRPGSILYLDQYIVKKKKSRDMQNLHNDLVTKVHVQDYRESDNHITIAIIHHLLILL